MIKPTKIPDPPPKPIHDPLTPMQSLAALIAKYEQARALKEEQEALAKDSGAEMKFYEKQVITAMHDLAEAQNLEDATKFAFEVEGYSYRVGMDTHYSITADKMPVAVELLRELGKSDLIKEEIPKKALKVLMEELLEENDGKIPDEYLGLGATEYSESKLSRRKAPKKKGA